MQKVRANKSEPLKGTALIPGDKSISHRALILGSLAIGQTIVSNLLESSDVLATANALKKMGVLIYKEQKTWCVIGRGTGGLTEPTDILDLGNSGTGVRLLMGVAGSHQFTSIFTGDSSLKSRPMERVTTPLSQMGIKFSSNSRQTLPITVFGAESLIPIEYSLPVPSAQVKSSILLAALNAPGETSVIEDEPTRNHTELMLQQFGATIKVKNKENRGHIITLTGQPELKAQAINVPGDISSAAFLIVAALIIPKSKVTLKNIGINPLRTGLLKTLKEMGALISVDNIRSGSGGEIANITAEASSLKGVIVPEDRVPSMIDEYPVLAVAAAYAVGTTQMLGVSELRVKESDRIQSMAIGLRKSGVKVTEADNILSIHGTGKQPKGGALISTNLDHRIAMAFLVFGLASKTSVTIDDASSINTSFPNFVELLNNLGGKIKIL